VTTVSEYQVRDGERKSTSRLAPKIAGGGGGGGYREEMCELGVVGGR
jgi:hypothetical protein